MLGQLAQTGAALAWAVAALAVIAAFVVLARAALARWRQGRQFRLRVRAEDALKHVYKARAAGERPTLESMAGSMQVSVNRAAQTVAGLQKAELLTLGEEGMRLTPSGERYALNVIRAHRLWEQHLAEKTGVAENEWHRRAERQEHLITPEQADSISAGLGHPTHDPHGDPIPGPRGDFPPMSDQRLSSLEPGRWARITHIEDEPEEIFAQIRAMGLAPGMQLRLLDKDPRRLRCWCDGEDHVLAPIVAANLTVQPLAEPAAAGEAARPLLLSHLEPGRRGRVVRLSPRCRGAERRRLMDLGILPGTVVRSELRSPTGGLTAYRVRDTLIALREEQAAQIQIEPLAEPAS